MLPVNSHAIEISPFRVTDINGSFALRYLYDDHNLSVGNITSSQTTYPTFQEELKFDSKAYVYHPNLLELDFGGGLLFDQSEFESLQGDSSSNAQLENYYLRLDFLNKKPYPFSFYYDQSNPSVNTGLTGRYIQENIRYGVDGSLLEPFSPVQVNVNAYHDTSQGVSADQIVDEVRDYSQISLYHSYGRGNSVRFAHALNRLDSRSGSPNLPIQPRLFTLESTSLNSKNKFGESNQFSLTNSISYITQDEYPVREDITFTPNLTWQHSEKWSSFYRYNLQKKDEDVQTTENQQLALGLTHSGVPVSANIDIHGYDNKTTGLEAINTGMVYSLNYRSSGNGKGDSDIGWGYGGSYDHYDQSTSISQVQVFDEEHILSGTTSVTLLHEFIDTATIVVSNTSRTQIYLENQDYRLIVIGSRVQLQRLASGNILDGQAVLVDYSYNTGGTYVYEIVTQNISMNYSFYRYYEFYSQYQFYRQSLIDGAPTLPLNSISRYSIGLSADRPLSNGMTVGGELSYVNNNEDISPNIENRFDVFLEMPLPKLTDLRLSANYKQVDYDYSEEDVDLNGYNLRINSQPWLRTSVVFESSYENDTGGSITRLWQRHRLQFRWRIRQLIVDFNAKFTTEEQGETVRDHWSVMFVAKRHF